MEIVHSVPKETPCGVSSYTLKQLCILKFSHLQSSLLLTLHVYGVRTHFPLMNFIRVKECTESDDSLLSITTLIKSILRKIFFFTWWKWDTCIFRLLIASYQHFELGSSISNQVHLVTNWPTDGCPSPMS